jgi:hypothetical protein
VSDFTLNSFFVSSYESGFVLDVSKILDSIPSSKPIEILTDYIGLIIPEITSKYGHGQKVDLKFKFIKGVPEFRSVENKGF